MPLTEEHKKKMAEGRARVAAEKAEKKAAEKAQPSKPSGAATPPPSPRSAVATPPTPAPAAAGGFLPTEAEWAAMERYYAILMASNAVPRGQGDGVLTKDQALLCMLKGRELGLLPLEALQGLFVHDTGLGMRADLQRALVQRSGIGVVIPIESTPTKCTVRAVRYGVRGRQDEVAEFTFTIEQAAQKGLMTSKYWREDPQACLFAKASGMACDRVFSDVLGGARYIPEELVTVQTAKASGAGPTEPGQPATSGSERAPAPAQPKASQPAQEPPATATPSLPLGQPQSVAQATPPAQPGPSSSAPQPRNADTFTHSFPVQGKDGAIEVRRTAGITKTLMEAILTLATASPDVLNRAQEKIRALGQPKLAYLTEAEGIVLLRELRDEGGTLDLVPPVQTPPVPANGSSVGKPTALAALHVFAEEIGRPYEQVLRFVTESYAKALDDMTVGELEQALKEMRHANRDTAGFGLMLDRAGYEPRA